MRGQTNYACWMHHIVAVRLRKNCYACKNTFDCQLHLRLEPGKPNEIIGPNSSHVLKKSLTGHAIKQSFYDDLHVMIISSRNRIVCVKSTVIVYLVIASTRRQKQCTLSRLYYTNSFSCMSKKNKNKVSKMKRHYVLDIRKQCANDRYEFSRRLLTC